MVGTLINKLHKCKVLSFIFPTLDRCLQRELKGCDRVLDLGCGPSSPIQYCKNVKFSLGIEAFKPYLETSKKNKIHSQYMERRIEDLDFPEKSFDAVMMIEVLEHLPEGEAFDILKKAEKWAKNKIIISSPNGFIPQKEVDNNPLQAHLSGWDYEKMKKLGFKIKGLSGLGFLRQEVQGDTMGNDLTSSIRFKPRFFWFVAATISQTLTYHYPKLAFELFSVKNLKNNAKNQSEKNL